jgi:hypothetical protein
MIKNQIKKRRKDNKTLSKKNEKMAGIFFIKGNKKKKPRSKF